MGGREYGFPAIGLNLRPNHMVAPQQIMRWWELHPHILQMLIICLKERETTKKLEFIWLLHLAPSPRHHAISLNQETELSEGYQLIRHRKLLLIGDKPSPVPGLVWTTRRLDRGIDGWVEEYHKQESLMIVKEREYASKDHFLYSDGPLDGPERSLVGRGAPNKI